MSFNELFAQIESEIPLVQSQISALQNNIVDVPESIPKQVPFRVRIGTKPDTCPKFRRDRSNFSGCRGGPIFGTRFRTETANKSQINQAISSNQNINQQIQQKKSIIEQLNLQSKLLQEQFNNQEAFSVQPNGDKKSLVAPLLLIGGLLLVS